MECRRSHLTSWTLWTLAVHFPIFLSCLFLETSLVHNRLWHSQTSCQHIIPVKFYPLRFPLHLNPFYLHIQHFSCHKLTRKLINWHITCKNGTCLSTRKLFEFAALCEFQFACQILLLHYWLFTHDSCTSKFSWGKMPQSMRKLKWSWWADYSVKLTWLFYVQFDLSF